MVQSSTAVISVIRSVRLQHGVTVRRAIVSYLLPKVRCKLDYAIICDSVRLSIICTHADDGQHRNEQPGFTGVDFNERALQKSLMCDFTLKSTSSNMPTP